MITMIFGISTHKMSKNMEPVSPRKKGVLVLYNVSVWKRTVSVLCWDKILLFVISLFRGEMKITFLSKSRSIKSNQIHPATTEIKHFVTLLRDVFNFLMATTYTSLTKTITYHSLWRRKCWRCFYTYCSESWIDNKVSADLKHLFIKGPKRENQCDDPFLCMSLGLLGRKPPIWLRTSTRLQNVTISLRKTRLTGWIVFALRKRLNTDLHWHQPILPSKSTLFTHWVRRICWRLLEDSVHLFPNIISPPKGWNRSLV
jgi:hypothetical protein